MRLQKAIEPRSERFARGRLALYEPQSEVRHALTTLLYEHGWAVAPGSSAGALDSLVRAGSIDAVISDVHLPDRKTNEFLEYCTEQGMPVIFIGNGLPLQGAVDLVLRGAFDFLEKPFPQSRLLESLDLLTIGQHARLCAQVGGT